MMPTNVLMPQMGESIAEGTIVRWIKKVGDKVDRDEPLFEISTDKVDAEIQSPTTGILTEIRAKEGETVPIDSIVAVIGVASEELLPSRPDARGEARVPASPERDATSTGEISTVQLRRRQSSPFVRRIVQQHNVDMAEIHGTGIGGRVTKNDVLKYVEARSGAKAGSVAPVEGFATAVGPVVFSPGERTKIVPMTVMRQKIAEHMMSSRRTSAHVHSVFEVDFSRVAAIREAKMTADGRATSKLTYMVFIAKAASDALRAVPVLNASVDGGKIVYRKDINLGIAVALEWGLIVPVVKRADELDVLALSLAIADLAERARSKRLKPEDVEGGTFTLTNPGAFGSLAGMPIINQPQVAVLCIGAIEKRPVVVDDVITIRPRAYLTLGFDHRLIDGAVADQFLSRVKQQLESLDPAAV